MSLPSAFTDLPIVVVQKFRADGVFAMLSKCSWIKFDGQVIAECMVVGADNQQIFRNVRTVMGGSERLQVVCFGVETTAGERQLRVAALAYAPGQLHANRLSNVGVRFCGGGDQSQPTPCVEHHRRSAFRFPGPPYVFLRGSAP